MSNQCSCKPRCPVGAACKRESLKKFERRSKSQVQRQQGDVTDGSHQSSSHVNSTSPPVAAAADRPVKRKHCALDFDTLDCPICLEPLFPPVFQCLNGHPACATCCKQLRNGPCPSCALPIGSNRCNAVEKIIESLQVSCKFTPWGCTEMLQYVERLRENHERLCKFRPYRCPVEGCNHEGLKASLPVHFHSVHNAAEMEQMYTYEDADRKFSFRIHTKDSKYDHSHSQYVFLNAVAYEYEEDEDEEEQREEDSEDGSLFLIHHQFHEKFSRYSFSCTSFGACNPLTRYRLSVKLENTRGFKGRHSIEGSILDNQKDSAILSRVVRQGDCLLVPKVLPGAQKDVSSFKVGLSLLEEEEAEDEEADALDDVE